MSDDLPIRCDCGAVTGTARGVRRHDRQRAVCYCRDCQAFAHFLGRAPDILDVHGGTEVLQMSQADLSIATGMDRLACMRLSPRGLYRWYTACCDTPIGNIPASRQLPYLGLIDRCLAPPADAPDLDALLGPVWLRVHAGGFHGERDGLRASNGIPLSALAHVGARVIGWRLRGDHRRSPFFDAATGATTVTARVLDRSERQALAAAVERGPTIH